MIPFDVLKTNKSIKSIYITNNNIKNNITNENCVFLPYKNVRDNKTRILIVHRCKVCELIAGRAKRKTIQMILSLE